MNRTHDYIPQKDSKNYQGTNNTNDTLHLKNQKYIYPISHKQQQNRYEINPKEFEVDYSTSSRRYSSAIESKSYHQCISSKDHLRYDSSRGQHDSSRGRRDSSRGRRDSSRGRRDSSRGRRDSSRGRRDSSSERYNPSREQHNWSRGRYDLSKDQYNSSRERYNPSRDQYNPYRDQYNPSRDQYNPSRERYNPSRDQRYNLHTKRYNNSYKEKRYSPIRETYRYSKDRYSPPKDRYNPPHTLSTRDQYSYHKEQDNSYAKKYNSPNEYRQSISRNRYSSSIEKKNTNERYNPNITIETNKKILNTLNSIDGKSKDVSKQSDNIVIQSNSDLQPVNNMGSQSNNTDSQLNIPDTHIDTAKSHANIADTHIDTVKSHANIADTHIDTVKSHANIADTHIDTAESHANIADSQPNTAGNKLKKTDIQSNTPCNELNIIDTQFNYYKVTKKYTEAFASCQWGCRNVNNYKILNKIDEGAFGVVYRGEDCYTKEIVALKHIRQQAEHGSGEYFPITSQREYLLLRKITCPNIVRVKEMVIGNISILKENTNIDNNNNNIEKDNEIYMVMEFCEHDLKMLMRGMDRSFKQGEVKCMMLQLLHGQNTLHSNHIIHRDLKTSNMLLTDNGIIKIADFGSSRHYSSFIQNYTCPVITLWYRPPELLHSSKIQQNPSIDIWSAGCIFAEMILGRALFQGRGEIDQLQCISKVLGISINSLRSSLTADINVCANNNIVLYSRLRKSIPVETYNNERCLSNIGFDLLCSMLQIEPIKRISAEKALQHPYFMEHPLPIDPHQMPKYTSFNANPDERERARRRMNEFGDHNIDTIYSKSISSNSLHGSTYAQDSLGIVDDPLDFI